MFTEDRAAFLNQDEHAVAAVFDAVGANTAVSVLFDRAHLEQLDISGTNPVARGDADDFPEGSTVDKTLTIDGVSYTITDRRPVDDGAFVDLDLRLTS